MGGRIRFALERFDSPRHRSHVAQLFSLGHHERAFVFTHDVRGDCSGGVLRFTALVWPQKFGGMYF